MPEVVVVKEIKPARLKDDALRKVLTKGMEEQAKEILKDFEATTDTWEHDVKFTQELNLVPHGPEVLVGTDDEVYGYVNDGTRPHPIFSKGTWPLKFQWGGKGSYKAKTKPRVIGSFEGGPSGPIVRRMYVSHPGTAARHFDEEIEKKQAPRFKRRMEQAMRDAAKASGHGQ